MSGYYIGAGAAAVTLMAAIAVARPILAVIDGGQ